MSQVPYNDLRKKVNAEESSVIRDRVARTREIQKKRFNDELKLNSDMNNNEIKFYSKLDAESEKILELAYNKMNLSARALNSVLKISRTIADLENIEKIGKNHVIEALSYRRIDREFANDMF